MTTNGIKPFYRYFHSRVWIDKDGGEIFDQDLKEYDWRWSGHFNTYIGKLKRKRKSHAFNKACKRGNKSE